MPEDAKLAGLKSPDKFLYSRMSSERKKSHGRHGFTETDTDILRRSSPKIILYKTF